MAALTTYSVDLRRANTKMTESVGFSSHHTFIELALKETWKSFEGLMTKDKEFSPLPLSAFQELRDSEVKRLAKLNPGAETGELEELVAPGIALQADPAYQHHTLIFRPMRVVCIQAIFNSHALCEAIINIAMSIYFAKSGTPELFEILEKSDLKQKWTHGPKLIKNSYCLEKGKELYETLSRLIKLRNSYVHYKPNVEVNGGMKIRSNNSHLDEMDFSEQNRWMIKFFNLPYDLAEHITYSTMHPAMLLLSHRLPIRPLKSFHSL